MTKNTLTSNIRLKAFEQGVTHAEMAAAIGKTQQTFKGRMNGASSFTLEELYSIAGLLGIEVEDLTGKRLIVAAS